MLVTALTKASFRQFLHEGPGTVLVEFWGGGCSRCRTLVPVLRDLALAHRDRIALGSVNVDLESELTRTFEIATLPTIIGFRQGQQIASLAGARCDRSALEDLVMAISEHTLAQTAAL